MTVSSQKPGVRRDWEALARRAAGAGDLVGARAAFMEALRQNPRNAQLLFEHALALKASGEIEEAAVHLTRVLRLKPDHAEAARQLSQLHARFEIAGTGAVEPLGLKAALAHGTIDPQPIVDAAFRHFAATLPDLADALAATRSGHACDAARRLALNRTSDVLRSDLLLAALQAGTVMDADLERLLTAVRRLLLLELPPERFGDRALTGFALALLAQGWNNDHAWAETEAETAALAGIAIDQEALRKGDLAMARLLVLAGLYRPLDRVLDTTDAEFWLGLRPKPLRDLVLGHLRSRRRERAAALPRLGELTDPTSRRVARQYETSPYPRWRGLQAPPAGAGRVALERFFEPRCLNFMDGDFEVLVAGAGTGLQALQAACGYGPRARILATDLSAASLGYAADAAQRHGIANIEFLVGDILDLARLERSFDIIECVGVLHHMADPWEGWRRLLAVLKPDGLMHVGLYSALSRRNIRRLREEAGYPGPGCPDQAARAFRADLLARPAGTPGAELRGSRDFYTLHEFRDLALHESEQSVTLAAIAAFLDENRLRFRGFALDTPALEAFAAQNPAGAWPGSLQAWQEFEQARPGTFDAMYRLWCDRRAD